MPHKARIDAPDALHHIIFRGIERRRIFADEKLLRRFQEPAWNYQVIRFLNTEGNDIIPRKDRIWTTSGVASRMIEALQAANRSIPEYLEALAQAEH